MGGYGARGVRVDDSALAVSRPCSIWRRDNPVLCLDSDLAVDAHLCLELPSVIGFSSACALLPTPLISQPHRIRPNSSASWSSVAVGMFSRAAALSLKTYLRLPRHSLPPARAPVVHCAPPSTVTPHLDFPSRPQEPCRALKEAVRVLPSNCGFRILHESQTDSARKTGHPNASESPNTRILYLQSHSYYARSAATRPVSCPCTPHSLAGLRDCLCVGMGEAVCGCVKSCTPAEPGPRSSRLAPSSTYSQALGRSPKAVQQLQAPALVSLPFLTLAFNEELRLVLIAFRFASFVTSSPPPCTSGLYLTPAALLLPNDMLDAARTRLGHLRHRSISQS
ncbi:hypothetical protein MSAN_01996400 [Mycena sanguinolenta]|uniref:Uncharacterized protein n=1 Tax=Mycena sanguinolenta TaxID=230812 RepID=A0A8H7CNV5_9AGAR|nr:hypothetical protein MSAN_01996400 [Mycena sanguinolenta]